MAQFWLYHTVPQWNNSQTWITSKKQNKHKRSFQGNPGLPPWSDPLNQLWQTLRSSGFCLPSFSFSNIIFRLRCCRMRKKSKAREMRVKSRNLIRCHLPVSGSKPPEARYLRSYVLVVFDGRMSQPMWDSAGPPPEIWCWLENLSSHFQRP